MSQQKKIGIIAGNRLLPLVIAQRIKIKEERCKVIAICFKGETSPFIAKYVDRMYWVNVGQLRVLKEILKKEGIKQCVMAGQINPLRIFKKKGWDKELISLLNDIRDFRPHEIFGKIIECIEAEGITFLDSTLYLKEDLAHEGVMNQLSIKDDLKRDINFGLKIVSKFVDIDVGQMIAVKGGSIVALESLEGTNSTIKRAYNLASKGCAFFKFSKINQDLRFDVPVVGLATLKVLRRVRAAGLVLEKDRVIILEKEKFLSLAKSWQIPVIGAQKP